MNLLKNIAPFLVLAFLAACNLTKDVDLDLPDYEGRPVVECYLEPGKPMRMLLTQSFGFFDQFDTSIVEFLDNATLDSALVQIEYKGEVFTLKNQYDFDLVNGRIYNYVNPALVPEDYDSDFKLNITLADGRTIAAQTRLLPVVPIDSIVVNWSPTRDSLARVLTYLTDDRTKTNYYRRVLNYSSLDSVPDQDFIVRDNLNTTDIIAFGTGYELKEGDTVFNTVYHITEPHFNFIESFQLAIQANLNPFSQPSEIQSNLSGTANALGIFTGLAFDRDTTIIRK